MNVSARGRVGEVKFMRVKVVSGVSRQRGTVSSGWNCREAAGAVERVANQRMSGDGKVNPDLMGAAGDEIDTNQAPIAVRDVVEDPAFRPGGFSFACCRVQVPGRRIGNPAYGHVHRKPIGHVRAGDECAVGLFDAPAPEILGEELPCRFGTCEQNNAGGSPPQAMKGRRPRGFPVVFADAGEQRVPKVLAAGQHGEAGRFGYGNQVVVFVEQCKRTGGVRFPPRPPVVGEPMPLDKRGFGRGRPVIQPHFAGQDPFSPRFSGRVRIAPDIELKNGFPRRIRLDTVYIGPSLICRRVFAHMREI